MSKAISGSRESASNTANGGESCVVCKNADARALTKTMLASGANVVVCGSHELVHRRAKNAAASIAELLVICGERRDRKDRRDGNADELGARLIAAFSGERRERIERRA